MELHPRHIPVANAKSELGLLLIDWQKRHKLTLAEELSAIADELASLSKWILKAERKED